MIELKNMNIKKQYLFFFIFFFFLSSVVNFINVRTIDSYKKNHLDNTFTYITSMLNDVMVLAKDNEGYFNAENPNKIYKELFYLKSENRFAYQKLYENQYLKVDVHPYLYYYVIHTALSIYSYLNDGEFTPYQLLMISSLVNCFFQAMIAVLLLAISKKLYKTYNINLIMIITSLYIMLPDITNMVAISRMYIMAIFCSSLYIWFFIRSEENDKHIDKMGLMISAFLGFGTSYLFLIFIGGILAVYFLHCFYSYGYRDNKIYSFITMSGSSALGIILLFIVFPQTMWHLTSSHQSNIILNMLLNKWEFVLGLVVVIFGSLYYLSKYKFVDYSSRFRHSINFTKIFSVIFFGALLYFIVIKFVLNIDRFRYYSLFAIPFLIWVGGVGLFFWKNNLVLQKSIKIFLTAVFSILFLYYAYFTQQKYRFYDFEDRLVSNRDAIKEDLILSNNLIIVLPERGKAEIEKFWNNRAAQILAGFQFYKKNIIYSSVKNACSELNKFEDGSLVGSAEDINENLLKCISANNYNLINKFNENKALIGYNFSKRMVK